MEKEVKEGDTVIMGGAEYVFGKSSTNAFNNSLNLLAKGVEPDESMKIHLWTSKNDEIGELFSFSELKEALERAEWNKTPHGL